jgi:multidrug efflux pump
MMQGVAGKFIYTLPILVTVALLSSYICSLTVVPVVGDVFLKPISKKKKESKFSKLSKSILKIYDKLLDIALVRPSRTIIIAVAMLVASSLLIPSLGLQLFPFVERDQYVIDVTIMDGSKLDKTNDIVRQIEEILAKDETVDTYLSKSGDGIPKYYTSFFPNQIASNKAQFIVNGSKEEIHKLQQQMDESIVGARIEVKQLENAIPVGLPVQVRISGEDIDTLRSIARDVKEKLNEIDEGQNVQDDYGYETPKLIIDVNKDKANMVGITNYDISKTVRMVINGLEVTKIKTEESDEDTKVILKIPEEDKNNKEIIEKIYVTSQITNRNVPLGQIADIRTEFALNKILRRDRVRTITTGLYPKPGHTAAEVLKIVEEKMSDYDVPIGYRIELGGENEDRTETFESLVGPFYMAAALIYLILMFQFFDLAQPLIIMGTIPLSFIGVILGLKVTGYPIGFMALMGAVSLMGIVVNNGIVLLDYINLLTKEGKELLPSVKEACITRLRPIMIGMVTTVIGLVPMGLAGGSLWAPLAYSIIFGLFVSSILTMLVIPAAFLAFRRLKEKRQKLVEKMTS